MTDPAQAALDDLTRALLAVLVVTMVRQGTLTEATVLDGVAFARDLLKRAGEPGVPQFVMRSIDDSEIESYRAAVDDAYVRVMRAFDLLMAQP